ncbi:MAG TPA: DUF1775 domain-containing protein [Rhizomicrobium sp.]|nr:DUF1775 domain-containing protein [Rhizomicrobium sp.]
MRNKTILAFLLAATTPAAAHVTLAVPTAKAGSHFVATFRIGHGCDGSPTTALKIELPDSIVLARPQPKPGWRIAMDRVRLASAQKGDMGEAITERISAITWKGGSLPADEFDEFSMMFKVPAQAGKITFPATQTCAKGAERWAGADKMHPAPTLTVAANDDDSMGGMDMHDHDMHDMAGMDMSAPSSAAKPGKVAPVKITDAWIRALPSGLPAGGYFTLRNEGDKTLELTSASSPSCGMLMLHKSENTGGMSHMSDVTSLKIAPKATLTFAPGGYHLMCMKPKALKPGDTASVTLKFTDGSQADANFAVKSATGN